MPQNSRFLLLNIHNFKSGFLTSARVRKTDVYNSVDLTCILRFRLAFYAVVWYLINILGGFPSIKVCDYNGKEKTSLG